MGPDRKPVIGADGKPEIAWIPRPQISCAQDVAEGHGHPHRLHDGAGVPPGRDGVPAHQSSARLPHLRSGGRVPAAGVFGRVRQCQSRFLERKVKKPKNIELGPRVTLDAERCVLCSRCIRFMKEVAKDDVLGFVDRGSYSTIACHPGPAARKQLLAQYGRYLPRRRADLHGFPFPDARLVPEGDQDHRRE